MRRVFREHVTSARFQEGVERGRWQMVGDIAWPVVMIAIAAGPRGRSPSKYVLRFDLTGYPETAPTATPWNLDTRDALEPALRPKGEQVGHIFRTDWENGQALYAPFDRVALDSHPRLEKPAPSTGLGLVKGPRMAPSNPPRDAKQR